MSLTAHLNQLQMQTLIFLSLLAIQPNTTEIQLDGSWINQTKNGETHVLLFSGHYFTYTTYQTESGAFIMTKGGTWKLEKDLLWYDYEFHTQDSSLVGQSEKQFF